MSIGRGRGCGWRFSQRESGGGPRVSSGESGLAIKDEEKVKFNSNKFRVYDKNFLPDKVSPLMKIVGLENTINNLQQPATEGVQQEEDIIKHYKCKITKVALKKQKEMLRKELDNYVTRNITIGSISTKNSSRNHKGWETMFYTGVLVFIDRKLVLAKLIVSNNILCKNIYPLSQQRFGSVSIFPQLVLNPI